jgi:hypothetical protein
MGGRTEEEAKHKINTTDIPNAQLIEKTRSKADRIIEVERILELESPTVLNTVITLS